MIGIQCETIDEDKEENVPNEFREAFEEIVTSELVEVEASELFESDKESKGTWVDLIEDNFEDVAKVDTEVLGSDSWGGKFEFDLKESLAVREVVGQHTVLEGRLVGWKVVTVWGKKMVEVSKVMGRVLVETLSDFFRDAFAAEVFIFLISFSRLIFSFFKSFISSFNLLLFVSRLSHLESSLEMSLSLSFRAFLKLQRSPLNFTHSSFDDFIDFFKRLISSLLVSADL